MMSDFCREVGTQRVSEDRQYGNGICQRDMLQPAVGGYILS